MTADKWPGWLRDQLKQRNWIASELARRMFGTTKNRRGNNVAKNRDAISRWLAGGYPDHDNLVLLAQILGISVDEIPANPNSAQPTPPPKVKLVNHLEQLVEQQQEIIRDLRTRLDASEAERRMLLSRLLP